MMILSKYIFLAGIFFILLGGLSVFLNHLGLALKIMTLSFWIMVGGVLFYIFELKNEK